MPPSARHWQRAALALCAGFLGCSSPSGVAGGAGTVTGNWCGIDVATAADCVGDEVIYAELTQAGSAVSGQSCEYYLAGCYPIENGSFAGGGLVFDYLFSVDRVDASLTVGADGQTLVGTYASTKCGCDIPVTLHRLD